MSKVTVLLTSYNHENFIKETIDSILDQTFNDFEVYIIDDCSTDNSWEIIKSYNDKRIIKIRNTENKNNIVNHELFSKFQGEYFAMAHSDDTWDKTKLEKQVKYLDEHKNIAACFTWVELIDINSKKFENSQHPYSKVFNIHNRNKHQWLKEFYEHGNRLCHPSSMIRMSAQLKEDLFVYGMGSLPDFYRWVKLCLNNDIYIIEEKLTNFRIQNEDTKESGINQKNTIGINSDLINIAKLYTKINKNDFLNIFPKAKKYLIHNKINYEYAMAMTFLESNYKQFKLTGLEILFNLLNNKESKSEIANLYNFQTKDLINLTRKYDIFNAINSDAWLSTNIWCFQDYLTNPQPSQSKYVFIQNEDFYVEYAFKQNHCNKIRFDPDEQKFRVFWELEFYLNNNIISAEPFGTKDINLENESIMFYTPDPQFYIDIPKGTCASNFIVKGKTRLLEPKEIEQHINSLVKPDSIRNQIKKKILNTIRNC